MLQPIKANITDVTHDIICVHWKEFPPRAAIVAKSDETTINALYQEKKISASDWQHCQFWVKNCGKLRMDSSCTTCPLVRFLEIKNHLVVMVSPFGGAEIPIVDSTTLATLSKWRVVPAPSFKQGA